MYHNEQIYTQAKKHFKSKDVFTYQDILDWLNKNYDEYNKIYEGSIGCKSCNTFIKYMVSEKEDLFVCQGNPPTEEYKFYNFYKTILVLTKYKYENINAKIKLEEYERIVNNEEKVRDWLLDNQTYYNSFWRDNSSSLVDIGSKLLYYPIENNTIKDIKFLMEKTNIKYSIALSRLFNVLYLD